LPGDLGPLAYLELSPVAIARHGAYLEPLPNLHILIDQYEIKPRRLHDPKLGPAIARST